MQDFIYIILSFTVTLMILNTLFSTFDLFKHLNLFIENRRNKKIIKRIVWITYVIFFGFISGFYNFYDYRFGIILGVVYSILSNALGRIRQ